MNKLTNKIKYIYNILLFQICYTIIYHIFRFLLYEREKLLKKRNDKPDVFIYCTGKTAQIGGGGNQ